MRNEIYFIATNGPLYTAPTATFSVAPVPVTTNIENDKDSVTLDMTMKLSAGAHATDN